MRVRLSIAALALLCAAPAFAENKDWTGLYAGLNAGVGIAGLNLTTTGQVAINNNTIADGARPGSVDMEMTGFSGGGQVGFNWHGDGGWVYGLEADIQYTDINEDRTVVTTGSAFPGTRNNRFVHDLDYLGTLRGRFGYAFDRTMLYATGGLAYGAVNNRVDFSGPLPAATAQFTGSESETKTGYAVGGGLEHFFQPNLSVKGEYLYYDLGQSTVAANVIPGSGGVGTGYNVNFDNSGHLIRVGLNYKLD